MPWLLPLLLSSVIAPGAARAQSVSLRIITERGVHEVAATPESIAGVAGGAFFPATALERIGVAVDATATGARALLFGDTLVFITLSSFFSAGDESFHLPFPVGRADGAIQLPEQFFTEWLPQRYPHGFRFEGGALHVTAPPAALAASTDQAASSPSVERGGRVGRTLRAPTTQPSPRGVANPPGEAGRAAAEPSPRPAEAGRTAAAERPPIDSARTPQRAGRDPESSSPDRAAAGRGAVAPRPGMEPTPRPVQPPAGRRTGAAPVVVIDPGHGGPDPGRVGPTGLKEKDFALALAGRLARLLNDRGYEVHLTRTGDTLIALDDRPRIANRLKGERPGLLLSIHANAHRSADVRGFETFFLSDARTDDERRVAEMENAAVEYEERRPDDDAVGYILNEIRNDFYVRTSNDLAGVVQTNLAGFHSGPDRGVKRAGFRVLVGALMPAVLVEAAFISNPAEARLLGTAAFQQKIVWALADAVDDFFARNGGLFVR